jgi:hypothetical protein
MQRLESRIAALESMVINEPKVVLMMELDETEGQALARCGHPPGTDAFFIQLVGLRPHRVAAEGMNHDHRN